MAQDLNRYFQLEAEDLLARISAALELLKQDPATPESLRDLRRWTHTLKGAAQVVRREEIARSAHRLETELDTIAASGGAATAFDAAVALAAGMRQALGHPAAPVETATAAPAKSPEQDSFETLRIELRELDSLLQTVNESAIVASSLRRLFAPLNRAADLSAMLRRELSRASDHGTSQHGDVIADEIEDVLQQVRRDLDLAAEHVDRELDGLRARAEKLRLLRADTMVPVLEQSVRAVAAASGKVVEFAASGGDLQLDAHVLIAARDALIQVARNAVAHGIENPEERRALGKPSVGRVQADFRRDGSRYVLEIADDGRGIDFDSLRGEAVRRGWLTMAQAREASSQDLTRLLLRPGMTTARSANIVAGRGVGLDLVNNTVARLKGELRISAERGKGTRVELRVPATLNLAPVLFVTAGGRTLGIPLDAVRRTATLASLDRLADHYVLGGRPLLMAPVAELFGRLSQRPSVAVEIVAEPRTFLLGVDSVVEIRRVVIHSLPDYVAAEPWVLGACIESAGELRLILDPALLAPNLEELSTRLVDAGREVAPALPILVIDDSMTTRMLEQSIFEMEGYSVDLASSAEEGLEMARRRQYGLFLVDVEMPGMDGFAFVERTRQDRALQSTPAILVTSRGSAEDRARGLNAGASEYVVKSEFDQRLLLQRVRELMSPR